jgi:hypothetical protein
MIISEIELAFEEWYGKNYPKSTEFPDEYLFPETQNAWLAFKAGYESSYKVAMDAIKLYYETKK